MPTPLDMAKSLLTETAQWAKKGFKLASGDVITERYSKCKDCQYWDKKAYGGSGKCTVCGCSTKAKLVLETSKCPEGKW
jgi:hypothetical protein